MILISKQRNGEPQHFFCIIVEFCIEDSFTNIRKKVENLSFTSVQSYLSSSWTNSIYSFFVLIIKKP